MTALSAPVRYIAQGSAVAGEEEFWALKDVSFEINKGEIVGIIGRNGTGKSTLLKIMSCITEPTTGNIEIRGRVASVLEVGTGFHQELTGRENIYLNGAILGMTCSKIDQRFDEIVSFAEVEKFLDTPVKHYSSGMYVRLAFAIAAHLEPDILIVDEVLAVGDVEFQNKCLGKLENTAGEGRTVLFVSSQSWRSPKALLSCHFTRAPANKVYWARRDCHIETPGRCLSGRSCAVYWRSLRVHRVEKCKDQWSRNSACC